MVQMDESIRKQLEKPQTWFCKYFPKRIQNVGEKEIADRQLVYDFKDGRSHEAVAQMTAARRRMFSVGIHSGSGIIGKKE